MTRSRIRKIKRVRPATCTRAIDDGHPFGLGDRRDSRQCSAGVRTGSPERRPGTDRRHRAEARGEPAERSVEHYRDRQRAARSTARHEFRRLRHVPPQPLVPERRAERRTWICAALHARSRERRRLATTPASPPSVGMYLDEQPITTIAGALDIHMYDIERVEALAGPQGTLYGASSEAGTVRIITNKPDPTGFKAGYDLEGNSCRPRRHGLHRRRVRQHPDLSRTLRSAWSAGTTAFRGSSTTFRVP